MKNEILIILYSMQSSKNTLQEFCQKRKTCLPTYSTYRESGPSHNPTFVSTVHLDGGYSFSAKGISKKNAEMRAASKANVFYGLEKEVVDTTTTANASNSDTAIFLDLENIGVDIEHFKNIVDAHMYGFAHADHNVVNRDLGNIQLVTTNSSEKDAADILLTMFVTKCIVGKTCSTYTNYYIVSSDHFAKAIADCIPTITDEQVCVKVFSCYGEFVQEN